MTIDPKLKMALTNHIPKEKELVLQLSKHEREWIREGKKAQMETNNVIKYLNQIMEKIHQAEETIEPESTPVQDAPITDKLDFLT